MNIKIKGMFQVFVTVCIMLLACICMKKSHDVKNSHEKIVMLLSYVTYSADMLKDVSTEGINSAVFPERNALIYCFSEDMCDECIYQDLAELYETQKEVGKDRVLLLPAYRVILENQIILRNKFHNFRYMNISLDSIKFPFHRENGLEQRFFVFTDEVGRIRSLFFPQKNKQDITRIYLSGVKRQMK